MTLARIDLMRLECPFWKLCGSGSGEGFTPRPNTHVWAILACWPDAETARVRTSEAPVYRRWRRHATEAWTLRMTPISSRGTWTRRSPFVPVETSGGPVAVLTRGSIRLRHLPKFWAHEPAISRAIAADPAVAFKIGLGEMPWLHQITFSVWPDIPALTQFARTDGPHARAIRAVREGGWFAEDLYARFHVDETRGHWGGGDPLSRLYEAA